MLLNEEYLGTRCEIKNMQNDLMAVGVLDKIKDDSITVGGKNDVMPLLPYKLKVKIVVFHSKLGSVILAGNVYLSNKQFLRIDQAERLSDFEKRNYFRVNVSMHTSINYRMEGEEELKSLAVDVKDISLNGISFHCSEKFDLGQRLEVMLGLLSAKEFYFKCTVMRMVLKDDKKGRPLFGCYFDDPTEEMTTALCAYLFQQQRLQLNKSKKSASGLGR